MHPYPHLYQVHASAVAEGVVTLGSAGLADIPCTPPPEFGGPEGYWSPETLLAGAIADCYVLSFRAVARASKVDWTSIAVEVHGTLDKVEGVTRFTKFVTHAKLVVPAGTDRARAETALQKSEKVCLVSNSLNGERHLETEIVEG
jgi:organic hydroperoxide reductase OsmC/OhrA